MKWKLTLWIFASAIFGIPEIYFYSRIFILRNPENIWLKSIFETEMQNLKLISGMSQQADEKLQSVSVHNHLVAR